MQWAAAAAAAVVAGHLLLLWCLLSRLLLALLAAAAACSRRRLWPAPLGHGVSVLSCEQAAAALAERLNHLRGVSANGKREEKWLRHSVSVALPLNVRG